MTKSMTDYTRKLTVPIQTDLVTVTAVPDGVYLDLNLITQSGELRPDQARELAALLLSAADDADHIDFANEDPDDISFKDDRG